MNNNKIAIGQGTLQMFQKQYNSINDDKRRIIASNLFPVHGKEGMSAVYQGMDEGKETLGLAYEWVIFYFEEPAKVDGMNFTDKEGMAMDSGLKVSEPPNEDDWEVDEKEDELVI